MRTTVSRLGGLTFSGSIPRASHSAFQVFSFRSCFSRYAGDASMSPPGFLLARITRAPRRWAVVSCCKARSSAARRRSNVVCGFTAGVGGGVGSVGCGSGNGAGVVALEGPRDSRVALGPDGGEEDGVRIGGTYAVVDEVRPGGVRATGSSAPRTHDASLAPWRQYWQSSAWRSARGITGRATRAAPPRRSDRG